MKKKDLFLISSALAAGLVSATTSNPSFAKWAMIATGAAAYLATPYRSDKKKERVGDVIESKKRIEKGKNEVKNDDH